VSEKYQIYCYITICKCPTEGKTPFEFQMSLHVIPVPFQKDKEMERAVENYKAEDARIPR
jgi:hypothetical protein